MAVKSIQYNQHTINISYEIVNPKAKIDLIILHGWGSSKNLMKKYFSQYMDSFRHIYIDLPGFGKSTCNFTLYTKDYAKIIELLMMQLKASKDIILGHSFGGKVATLLEPKLLVLLSSAGILTKKPILTRVKISVFKLLKPFGGKKLYKFFATKDVKGMSESMYETLKRVVNEDFSAIFSKYKGNTLMFWGVKDKATPLECGKKIASLLKKSEFFECKGDHFFFLSAGGLISDNIKRKYKEISS